MTFGTIEQQLNAYIERLGITSPTAVDRFLRPEYERDVCQGILLPDADRAVERLLRAIATGERIAVYADFDCDGIPAAVVCHDVFKKIGYSNIEVYIPHRDTEGFGVHVAAIDALADRGVTLILTVDVGSSAHEACAHAQMRGVDIIVTDHHECEHVLPPAYAVVNPKRSDSTYPFRDLCGSGVAFQLMRALLAEGRARGDARFTAIPEGWEKWLLDMVGVATVADMVPLHGENRVFASFGLVVLRKSRRPGIHALCRNAKAEQSTLTEESIGFSIAPRINAASRMGDPYLAFELFATDDPERAEACAAALEHLNNERKGLVGSIAKNAHTKIAERFTAELPAVVVLGDPSWKPAVLGSVAASLAEQYARPFFLWGKEATGLLKGSCRSHGGVDVLAIMSHASSALIQYGGHTMAGGFAVSDVSVHVLQEQFVHAHTCTHLQTVSTSSSELCSADIHLTCADVREKTVARIRTLAPFGVGNPEPRVRIEGCVVKMGVFGKEGQHTECVIRDIQNARTEVRCIAFFTRPTSFTYVPDVGDTVAVIGGLTVSRFAGRTRVEMRLHDIQSVSVTA